MKIILAGHGKIATEMNRSVKMIFGELSNFFEVEFYEGESMYDIVEKYKLILENESKGSETLIITDLFGGSPYNAAAALAMTNEKVEVLTGLSMPLCLEVASKNHVYTVKQIVDEIKEIQSDFVKSFRDIEITKIEEDF